MGSRCGGDLLRHVTGLGHDISGCPDVEVNTNSCRGFLRKMVHRKLKFGGAGAWRKRWFVFHRKMRALSYYDHDDGTNRQRPRGMIFFQSIQEVYVDPQKGSHQGSSHGNRFCLQTSDRVYVFSAPSLVAMAIWMDVLCTGREGAPGSL